MESYTTEEQQVEAIKKWFKENGTSTLLVIIIAFTSVFGWRAWNSSQEEKQKEASVIYQNMMEALVLVNDPEGAAKHKKTVEHLASQLMDEYTNLQYAQFAAMALAKIEVESGNLSKAAEKLQWVIDQKGDNALINIVKIRLARIYAAQKKYDEALMLLTDLKEASMRSLAEEVKGDIYSAMGEQLEARIAYQQSIDAATSAGYQMHGLVQMKLDDLAEVVQSDAQ